MKPAIFLLSILILGLIIFISANSIEVDETLTQFKSHSQQLTKKTIVKIRNKEIDWINDDGSHLKMRIPRKYISKIYKRTKENPHEWIIIRASYPEFKTAKETKDAKNSTMLRIELLENKDHILFTRNMRQMAENDVRRKKAYIYPNNWGLDHYKKITCLEHYPGNISPKFIEKSEPFRDELTPPDCWVSFSPEQFLPNPNTYAINYYCTPLIERPDGLGGCTVSSNYRGRRLEYVMRRKMIPQWKAVHEAILGFLDQFVITETEQITTKPAY